MVNGLIVAYTNTNAAISFGDFDLTDCTAGEILSSRGVKIAARLSGPSPETDEPRYSRAGSPREIRSTKS